MLPLQYSFAELFEAGCDLFIIAMTTVVVAYALGTYLASPEFKEKIAHLFHFTRHHETADHTV